MQFKAYFIYLQKIIPTSLNMLKNKLKNEIELAWQKAASLACGFCLVII